MFESFTEGFRQGYYGKNYVPSNPKPKTPFKFGSFLGRWQATADNSKQISEKMLQDPQWAKHFKLLNWTITLAVLIAVAFTIF